MGLSRLRRKLNKFNGVLSRTAMIVFLAFQTSMLAAEKKVESDLKSSDSIASITDDLIEDGDAIVETLKLSLVSYKEDMPQAIMKLFKLTVKNLDKAVKECTKSLREAEKTEDVEKKKKILKKAKKDLEYRLAFMRRFDDIRKDLFEKMGKEKAYKEFGIEGIKKMITFVDGQLSKLE